MRLEKQFSKKIFMIYLLILNCAKSDEHGFSRGLYRIDTGTAPKAEECRTCHKEIYNEWNNSRHRVSYTNELFQKAYANEKMDWCVNCHSPVQASDRNKNELNAEGISCAACHVRNGEMLSGKFSGKGTEHSFQKSKTVTGSEFCGSCHQFNFPSQKSREREIHYSNLPMQNTYREWQNSYFADRKTCQDCHMPFEKNSEGIQYRSHTFPGGHNSEYLQKSFSVELNRLENGIWELILTGKSIGHAFPTGDLFRNLEIRLLDRKNQELEKVILRYDYIRNNDKNIYSPRKKLFKKEILTEPLISENSTWHKFIRSDELKNAEFYELLLNFIGPTDIAQDDFSEPVSIFIKKERLQK